MTERLAKDDTLPTALPLLAATAALLRAALAGLALPAFALRSMRVLVLGLHRAVRAALGVGVLLLSRTLATVLRRIDAAAVLVKLDDLTLGAVLAQVQARAVLATLRLGGQLGGEVVLGEHLGLELVGLLTGSSSAGSP